MCGPGHAVLPSMHCMPSVPLKFGTSSFPGLVFAFTGVFTRYLKPEISFPVPAVILPTFFSSFLGGEGRGRGRHQELHSLGTE